MLVGFFWFGFFFFFNIISCTANGCDFIGNSLSLVFFKAILDEAEKYKEENFCV